MNFKRVSKNALDDDIKLSKIRQMPAGIIIL